MHEVSNRTSSISSSANSSHVSLVSTHSNSSETKSQRLSDKVSGVLSKFPAPPSRTQKTILQKFTSRFGKSSSQNATPKNVLSLQLFNRGQTEKQAKRSRSKFNQISSASTNALNFDFFCSRNNSQTSLLPDNESDIQILQIYGDGSADTIEEATTFSAAQKKVANMINLHRQKITLAQETINNSRRNLTEEVPFAEEVPVADDRLLLNVVKSSSASEKRKYIKAFEASESDKPAKRRKIDGSISIIRPITHRKSGTSFFFGQALEKGRTFFETKEPRKPELIVTSEQAALIAKFYEKTSPSEEEKIKFKSDLICIARENPKFRQAYDLLGIPITENFREIDDAYKSIKTKIEKSSLSKTRKDERLNEIDEAKGLLYTGFL